MNWLGLDVGGANLKLASSDGSLARSVGFPLWQRRAELEDALRRLLADAPPVPLAVTMTGELADCYATKAEGVAHIVEAVAAAAGRRSLRAYALDGELISLEHATRQPLLVAAANWHALASWAARFAAGATLLIDIGSTTTDLIPIVEGRPAARGRTDPERLVASELVYTGVSRSPVCAVARSLPWRGAACPTAQELFATTRDAYLTSGDLPEDAEDGSTADGRTATREAARDRLARQICADRTMFDEADARAAAREIEQAQLARLGIAARNVLSRLPAAPATVILSGEGEFLARRLLDALRIQPAVVSLAERLGLSRSRVAPAYALAVLAAERAS